MDLLLFLNLRRMRRWIRESSLFLNISWKIPLPSFFLFSSHNERKRQTRDRFLHFFICFYKLYWKWYFYITCVLFLPVHASSVLYEALLHTFDKLLASWKQETELFKRDPAHHKITKQLGKLPYSILPRA
ncbi:hypothetical protein ACJX0J_003586, partial (mitochondrion) [Zea mays]